jgi:hypothetical protein
MESIVCGFLTEWLAALLQTLDFIPQELITLKEDDLVRYLERLPT